MRLEALNEAYHESIQFFSSLSSFFAKKKCFLRLFWHFETITIEQMFSCLFLGESLVITVKRSSNLCSMP